MQRSRSQHSPTQSGIYTYCVREGVLTMHPKPYGRTKSEVPSWLPRTAVICIMLMHTRTYHGHDTETTQSLPSLYGTLTHTTPTHTHR